MHYLKVYNKMIFVNLSSSKTFPNPQSQICTTQLKINLLLKLHLYYISSTVTEL